MSVVARVGPPAVHLRSGLFLPAVWRVRRSVSGAVPAGGGVLDVGPPPELYECGPWVGLGAALGGFLELVGAGDGRVSDLAFVCELGSGSTLRFGSAFAFVACRVVGVGRAFLRLHPRVALAGQLGGGLCLGRLGVGCAFLRLHPRVALAGQRGGGLCLGRRLGGGRALLCLVSGGVGLGDILE